VHRTAAVNERNVTDKPAWIRHLGPIAPGRQRHIDRHLQKAMEVSLALDDMVMSINQALIDRGRPAVVVYMSDNGYLWGQHRDVGKNVPYDAAVRVPAGMWSLNGEPSVTPGTVVSSPVSNIDIAPTFAELAGVEPPTHVDGRSLLPLLDDQGSATELGRSRILIEHMDGSGGAPSFCAVREESWLFVRYRTGEEEAYDYESDPNELHNLASVRMHHEKIDALRDWTKRRCDPLPPRFEHW
jgi:N-acetylglucosamine-6-sulfatase